MEEIWESDVRGHVEHALVEGWDEPETPAIAMEAVRNAQTVVNVLLYVWGGPATIEPGAGGFVELVYLNEDEDIITIWCYKNRHEIMTEVGDVLGYYETAEVEDVLEVITSFMDLSMSKRVEKIREKSEESRGSW